MIQVKVLGGRRVSINLNKKQSLPSINPIIVLDFFVWGLHLAILWAYSWVYTQETPLGSAQSTLWDVGDRTLASHIQGKCPT